MDQDRLLNFLLSLDHLADEMKQCTNPDALSVLSARLRDYATLAEQIADALQHDVKNFILPNASERVQ